MPIDIIPFQIYEVVAPKAKKSNHEKCDKRPPQSHKSNEFVGGKRKRQLRSNKMKMFSSLRSHSPNEWSPGYF